MFININMFVHSNMWKILMQYLIYNITDKYYMYNYFIKNYLLYMNYMNYIEPNLETLY